MKQSNSINLKSRAAEKAASRQRDAVRIQQGESPEALQQENSIFSEDFFRNGKISNLAQAVGL